MVKVLKLNRKIRKRLKSTKKDRFNQWNYFSTGSPEISHLPSDGKIC